jgi:ribosomal-protein-alanine N-acetyltransferase
MSAAPHSPPPIADPPSTILTTPRLLLRRWREGDAPAACACVADGFARLRFLRIVAVTHPDHAASQHVLRKAGLRDAGLARHYGQTVRRFVVDAPGTAEAE